MLLSVSQAIGSGQLGTRITFSPSPYTIPQTLMSKLGSFLFGENIMVLLTLWPEAYLQDNEHLAYQQNITQLN